MNYSINKEFANFADLVYRRKPGGKAGMVRIVETHRTSRVLETASANGPAHSCETSMNVEILLAIRYPD